MQLYVQICAVPTLHVFVVGSADVAAFPTAVVELAKILTAACVCMCVHVREHGSWEGGEKLPCCFEGADAWKWRKCLCRFDVGARKPSSFAQSSGRKKREQDLKKLELADFYVIVIFFFFFF